MFWAILIVGVLFLLAASPGFRLAAILVVGALAAGIYFLVQNAEHESKIAQEQRAAAASAQARAAEEQDAAERLRWGKVSPTEVELRDLKFTPAYYGKFDVTAGLKNNSIMPITGVRFYVRAYDCPDGAAQLAQCDKIGGDELSADAMVPPGEVRGISVSASLSNMPPLRGSLSWRYVVSSQAVSLSPASPAKSSYQLTQVAKRVSGSFPLASCTGWDGTTTGIEGVNTGAAKMQGRITRADIQEYCNRDPGDETIPHQGKLTIPQCVTKYVRQTANISLFAGADCVLGDVSYSINGKLSGATHFPMAPAADNSCASGIPPLVAQFKVLCPLTFNALALNEGGRAR
jgi:hypothetical protein